MREGDTSLASPELVCVILIAEPLQTTEFMTALPPSISCLKIYVLKLQESNITTIRALDLK